MRRCSSLRLTEAHLARASGKSRPKVDRRSLFPVTRARLEPGRRASNRSFSIAGVGVRAVSGRRLRSPFSTHFGSVAADARARPDDSSSARSAGEVPARWWAARSLYGLTIGARQPAKVLLAKTEQLAPARTAVAPVMAASRRMGRVMWRGPTARGRRRAAAGALSVTVIAEQNGRREWVPARRGVSAAISTTLASRPMSTTGKAASLPLFHAAPLGR